MPRLNTLKNLTFIPFILISNIVFCQLYEVSLKHRVNEAELIIEGEVTDQESFITPEGFIYTKNFITPSKLFKGETNRKNLIVTTRGGEAEGFTETWSHLLSLDKGDYGVFFLNKSLEDPYNNYYNVFASSQGFLKLSSNLKETKMIDPFSEYLNIDREIYDQLKTNKFSTSYSSERKKTEENCLTFTVRPTNIGNRENRIYFDVFSSMTIEPMYLKDGTILVKYDPNQLGQNIVLNEKLKVFNGTYLPNEDYELTINDISLGVFEVKIESITSNRTLIDLFEKNLFTFYVDIETNEFPFLLIDENQVKDDIILLDPEDQTEQNPICVELQITVANENGNCPIITHHNSDVAAGVNQQSLSGENGVLTIRGSGFGEPYPQFVKPHLSDVLFWDIDDFGYFRAAELNYISWSDTLIQVMVPTMEKENDFTFRSSGACTKDFIVEVTYPDGTICRDTSQEFVVEYSLFNDPWKQKVLNWQVLQNTILPETEVLGGKRRNLVNQNGNGGYDLFIGEMYPNDPSKNDRAHEQIVKAVDRWRCDYKINLEIVSDTSNLAPLTFGTITKGALPFGISSAVWGRGTSSETDITICDSYSSIDSKIWGFNVVVSEDVLDTIQLVADQQGTIVDVTFNIDESFPTGTSFRYIDLQRIMLHELGHCFQIRHTNNIGDIMGSGRINPAIDNPSRAFTINDHSAALHVKDLSQIGACIWDGMIPYAGSCTTNTSNGINKQKLFEVFPNPSNGIFSVSFDNVIKSGTLDVLSITGELILSEKIEHKTNHQLNLNNNIPKGIYLLRLNSEEGEYLTRKIIINDN